MTREEIIKQVEPVLQNFFNKKNVDKIWADTIIDNLTDLITDLLREEKLILLNRIGSKLNELPPLSVSSSDDFTTIESKIRGVYSEVEAIIEGEISKLSNDGE